MPACKCLYRVAIDEMNLIYAGEINGVDKADKSI